jgi:pSer/pThr/pTyr-binding forkhead associated (FHA) protein
VADAQRLVTTLRHRLGDGPEHVVIWDTVEITVGRHPGQDLVVPDGDVSREHTVFRRERASFVVEDRGTALGTRVNGQRVRSAALDPGDVVEVGRLRIEFHQSQRAPRAGGRVRFASELKADAPALRGPGDRTLLGLELDDALASPVPAPDALRGAGPRALSDDGALEELPELGPELALPPSELEAWCAGGTAARDLDLELGLAGGPAADEAEDDPHATTLRDAGSLPAAAAPGTVPGSPRAETAFELALELRGPEDGVRGLLALLEAGELPLGPLHVRLRRAVRSIPSPRGPAR